MAQAFLDSNQGCPVPGEGSEACYHMGETIANQGHYAEALLYFDRAISLQPDFCAAWVFRAVVLLHLKQPDEALVSCDRALAICPLDSEALLFRGVALHRLGHYSEAYASYRQALGKQNTRSWQPRVQTIMRLWKSLVVDPLMQVSHH